MELVRAGKSNAEIQAELKRRFKGGGVGNSTLSAIRSKLPITVKKLSEERLYTLSTESAVEQQDEHVEALMTQPALPVRGVARFRSVFPSVIADALLDYLAEDYLQRLYRDMEARELKLSAWQRGEITP